MRDIQKETADKYQEFFNFMNQEHDLILTIEQMDEIVFESQRLVKKLTIPVDVGRREQLESGLTCMMCRKPKEKDGHSCCEDCGGLAF
jgi:hypothetical protein